MAAADAVSVVPEPSAVVVKLTVGASLTSVIVTICCVLVPVSALTGVPKFKTIKTDQYARIWLRWNKEFETISITDDFTAVAGKTVIIGNTAEGISTVIATPNGEQYSHTAMAVSLQTVINGENIVRLDTATFLEYVTAGILALIIILGR